MIVALCACPCPLVVDCSRGPLAGVSPAATLKHASHTSWSAPITLALSISSRALSAPLTAYPGFTSTRHASQSGAAPLDPPALSPVAVPWCTPAPRRRSQRPVSARQPESSLPGFGPPVHCARHRARSLAAASASLPAANAALVCTVVLPGTVALALCWSSWLLARHIHAAAHRATASPHHASRACSISAPLSSLPRPRRSVPSSVESRARPRLCMTVEARPAHHTPRSRAPA